MVPFSGHGDGIPDGWEYENWLHPDLAADASEDPDGDGLDNLAEYLNGTDPWLADSDGDGHSDGQEVLELGSDPTDPTDPVLPPENGAPQVTSSSSTPITTRSVTFSVGGADPLTILEGSDQDGEGSTLPVLPRHLPGGGSGPDAGAGSGITRDTGEGNGDLSGQLFIELRTLWRSYSSSEGSDDEYGGSNGSSPGYWEDYIDEEGYPQQRWVEGGGEDGAPMGPVEPHHRARAHWQYQGDQVDDNLDDAGSRSAARNHYEGYSQPVVNSEWEVDQRRPMGESVSAAVSSASETEGGASASGFVTELRLVRTSGSRGDYVNVIEPVRKTFLKIAKSRPLPPPGVPQTADWTVESVDTLVLEIAAGVAKSVEDERAPQKVIAAETREGFETVVDLLPVELRDIKDYANTGDDVAITNWDTTQTITDNNIAWIDAHTSDTDVAPRMPQLVFRIPGLPENVTVEAKFEADYTRGNDSKLHQQQDLVKIPDDGFKAVVGGVWEIYSDYPDGFFGGKAKLTYKIQGQEEQTISFLIAGENPDNTRCRDYIVSVSGDHGGYAYVIAKSESRIGSSIYNQFRSDGAAATNPNWHDDAPSSPGGYGIGQLTGTVIDEYAIIPREQIWNWQKNVEGLIVFLDSKRNQVAGFLNGERALANAYGHENSIPNIDLPRSERDGDPSTIRGNAGSYYSSTFNNSGGNRSNGATVGDVKVTLTNDNVLDFMTMKNYNGAGAVSPGHDNGTGHFCVYRGVDQAWEFRRRKSTQNIQPNYWHITYVTRVTAEYEDLSQPSPGD